jgi:hypothetical protein
LTAITRKFSIKIPFALLIIFGSILIFDRKLRYFTADGQLVPTPQEAELEQRQAKEQALLEKEQALLEKERERQAKEKLAQKLRELGIDPDTI